MGKYLVIALVVITALSCGKNEPLANYTPRSNEEQALKRILLDFQDGVNTQDTRKVENTIHANASLMVGRDRNILPKAEYIKNLARRLAENPTITLGKPKMKISGDKAEVKIYMARGGYSALIVFNMMLDNNSWYILDWKY